MSRTQAEVDALWPTNKLAYALIANVTIPGASTIQEAAAQLQKLYEGHEAMAGEFNVEPEQPNRTGEHPMFLVSFVRDVPDDLDVVNPALLARHDFESALRSQFDQEFVAAVKQTGINAKLLFLSLPEWIPDFFAPTLAKLLEKYTVTNVQYGDKYVSFKGGQSVTKNSHFWMKCRVTPTATA